MKKPKKGLKWQGNSKKVINLLIYLFLITYGLQAQKEIPDGPPGYKEGLFFELIEEHALENFKSGLFCTGLKNDTLFSVFYSSTSNNLVLYPIGNLSNSDSYLLKESANLNHLSKLRKTNGLLSSRIVSSFNSGQSTIFIVKQTLSQDIRLRKGEKIKDFIKERILYYSKSKGVFRVDYYESNSLVDNKYFNWPYKEGDIIFPLLSVD